jgi:ribosome-associated heat shock protein Hsp15
MSEDRQRLDKWLWYARFFKTRSLATRVCAARKVRINRVVVAKANAAVKLGDVLTFPQGDRIRVVEVAALGQRRGPAVEAQALYADLAPPPMAKARTSEAAAAAPASPAPRERGAGRPTKAERRATERLKSGDADSV